MSNFVPDEPLGGLGYRAVSFEQAYLEDRLAGYESTKSPDHYRNEILALLSDAGETQLSLARGQADGRTAYRLTFNWGGVDVQILQVALPTRSKSERALKQAERQALYHLLNELRFELERRHFHPNYPAFVPYMLAPGRDGEAATLGEIVAARMPLMLSGGKAE